MQPELKQVMHWKNSCPMQPELKQVRQNAQKLIFHFGIYAIVCLMDSLKKKPELPTPHQ